MQAFISDKSVEKKLHLKYLDGLRGVAAFYILLVHVEPLVTKEIPSWLEIPMKALRYGRLAVVVFIILSGYGLMLSVVRKGNGYLPGSFLSYIQKRGRRILPAYYATIGLCLLLAVTIFALERFTDFRWDKIAGFGAFSPYFSGIDALSYFLLIHNLSAETYHSINPPLWTVATEWQLYFFFPLLLLPIWRKFGIITVVITAFLVGLTPLYLFRGLFETASPWFLGLFTLGMVAADIGFSQKPKLIRLRNSLPWGKLGIIFAGVGFITEWRKLGLHIWVNETFFGLAIACFFIYSTKLVIENKKLPKILQIIEHPLAVALGAFSYSLYLTHGPVLVLVRYFLYNLQISPVIFAVLSYVVGTIASLGFAYLFYLIFEKPSLQVS